MRRGSAAAAMVALMVAATSALAQGITTPAPGSAPTMSGPNSANPSAAASDLRGGGATNPSAAASSSSPNVLNPGSTPSTFAPTSVGGGSSLRPLPSTAVRGLVRRSRNAARPATRQRRAARPAAIVPPGRDSGSERRARAIVGSVCRGC